jgi:hypothetical protein
MGRCLLWIFLSLPIFSASQAEVSFSLFVRVDPAQAEVPHQGFIVLGLSSSIFVYGMCELLQQLVLVYF